MMNRLDLIINNIEELQEATCYCIDWFPKRITLLHPYEELEQWLLKNEVGNFCEKVIRIVMKFSVYYPAVYYITELPMLPKKGNPVLNPYLNKINDDLSYDQLCEIIREVIVKDISSVQVFSESAHLLISINGGFAVNVYGLSKDRPDYELVRSIVQSEGLFLWWSGTPEELGE